MRLSYRSGVVLLSLGAFALSACAEGGAAGHLRRAGVAGTPDEFMVLPTRPLEMPADLAALPAPQPGATSRADYNPRADAVAGLTGRPAAAGVASAPALVARAGPVEAGIRATLRAEDEELRATNRGRLLERAFARDRSQIAYRDMVLDAGAEFQRLQALGVRVPAAPPRFISDEPEPGTATLTEQVGDLFR